MNTKLTSAEISKSIEEWKQAQDVMTIVLTAATQRHIIAEVIPTDGSYLRLQEMSAEERELLSQLNGRLPKKQVAAACKLAGTTFEAAQARRLVDTPETRAAARRAMGI